MEKLMYMTMDDVGSKSGVAKKILDQCGQLETIAEVYIGYYSPGSSGGKIYTARYEQGALHTIEEKVIGSMALLQRRSAVFNELARVIAARDIQNLYIRFMSFDSTFIHLLKKVRPHCKRICLELQTYPYRKEYVLNYPWYNACCRLIIDSYFSRKAKKYVDRIVTMSFYEAVLGVQCITSMNGIDLDRVPMRRPEKRHDGQPIRLLAVAAFAPWHGIDRLIAGLRRYYESGGTRDVVLHLVGEGNVMDELKALAAAPCLKDRVVFQGFLHGEELECEYDRADLAVCSLGPHRKNTVISSELKSREYLAKGIPIIYSGEIDVLMGQGVDFALQCPADDEPIDIRQVIAFYDGLAERYGKEELTMKIRAFAEETVSMKKTFRSVVEYFTCQS